MGIKQIKVKGNSKLIVNQIKKQRKARNPLLKIYRDVVWGEIDYFDTFNITFFPWAFNKLADSMASTTTIFHPYEPNPHTKYMIEVTF